jgi:hypothetical protein
MEHTRQSYLCVGAVRSQGFGGIVVGQGHIEDRRERHVGRPCGERKEGQAALCAAKHLSCSAIACQSYMASAAASGCEQLCTCMHQAGRAPGL